jgi:hypothetical protein
LAGWQLVLDSHKLVLVGTYLSSLQAASLADTSFLSSSWLVLILFSYTRTFWNAEYIFNLTFNISCNVHPSFGAVFQFVTYALDISLF